MKNDKVKVGVIGVGHLGEFHAQKYNGLDRVDLVAVVDSNLKRAKEVGSRYGANAYGEYREILDRVDAVSLAVPTELHFEISREILSHGIHLLVEKPIAYRVEDAEALIQLADEKGVVLQVGHVERFNPAVAKMISLLNRPVFIECHRLNLFTPRGTDVDVVLDLMIHDLDIVLHVVPSPVREIHAVGMPLITGKPDIANVRMIFENGTIANLTANRVSSKTLRKFRVFQTDMYVSVDCFKKEISITRLEDGPFGPQGFPQISSNKMSYPNADPLADQISSFIDALIHKKKPVVSGEDGRRVLKFALGICEQIDSWSRHFRGAY